MIWTPELTIKFIELYKVEPAIWDERCPLYKEKAKVCEAWERIEEVMAIPIVHLKRRKESLMSAFRLNYKKKIYQGHKPTWSFYSQMESFLKDLCEYKIVNNPKSFIATPPAPPQKKLKAQTIKRSNSDDPLEYEEDSEEMSQVLNTLTYCLDEKNQVKISQEEEEECDLYCRLISKRLLAFPYPERQELMYDIDGIILKRRLEKKRNAEEMSGVQIKRRRSSEISYVSPASSPTHIIYRPPSESD